jgi:hypothetical protein
MYFYNTDKIVLALLYDLYTDQYNKNQIGWLITLYKMGPGQVMLLYTSSLKSGSLRFSQFSGC